MDTKTGSVKIGAFEVMIICSWEKRVHFLIDKLRKALYYIDVRKREPLLGSIFLLNLGNLNGRLEEEGAALRLPAKTFYGGVIVELKFTARLQIPVIAIGRQKKLEI